MYYKINYNIYNKIYYKVYYGMYNKVYYEINRMQMSNNISTRTKG
jgi:hypothetical protein